MVAWRVLLSVQFKTIMRKRTLRTGPSNKSETFSFSVKSKSKLEVSIHEVLQKRNVTNTPKWFVLIWSRCFPQLLLCLSAGTGWPVWTLTRNHLATTGKSVWEVTPPLLNVLIPERPEDCVKDWKIKDHHKISSQKLHLHCPRKDLSSPWTLF